MTADIGLFVASLNVSYQNYPNPYSTVHTTQSNCTKAYTNNLMHFAMGKCTWFYYRLLLVIMVKTGRTIKIGLSRDYTYCFDM